MDGHTAERGSSFDSLLWSTALYRFNLIFSGFRGETCDLASLSALILVPFQEQEKVWQGLFGENYNRIAARGLGGLSPRSALQRLLRLQLHRWWWSGLRPLQGSKQSSNLQKKRKGFVLDPSDIQSFLLQKTVARDREDVQKTGACDLVSTYGAYLRIRCVVLFLSFPFSFFFFFLIPCVVFSKGRDRRFGEGLLGENYNRIAAGGLGGLSPRSALQRRLLCPRLCRRSGLRPLQGSKQASNLQKEKKKDF